MSDLLGWHASCPFCPEVERLPSEKACQDWYLIHLVDRHWDVLERAKSAAGDAHHRIWVTGQQRFEPWAPGKGRKA